MLSNEQLGDLKNARKDIENKSMILNTAIDIQALLRLLVEKGIISKPDMNRLRNEVRSSPRYANAFTYVEQTLREIAYYENDPQALLREMFQRKTNS